MEKRSRITPYLLVILIAVLVTSFGCGETFFDEKAGDRITPDQHYQSTEDAIRSTIGAIMPLQDFMPKLIVLDGLRSDMMDVTSNADADLRDINNQSISPGNYYTNTSDLYKVIININEVLANIERVGLKDREFDAYYTHNTIGSLIGFRAWTYLTLVRLYGKAAYIDGNMVAMPASVAQKVLSRDAMIDTLIKQVTPYIQNTVTSGLIEMKFGNYPNNKALLGELYLEKNNFDSAVYYLKLACESYLNGSAMLKVDKTYKELFWKNIFFNAETAELENLSVIPYSSTEGQYNVVENWLGHNFQYSVKPTQARVDSFMVQVPSAGAPGDLFRGRGVSFSADTLWITDTTFTTENYITKYEIDDSDPFSSDIIISRAADIHLMLAEALNRKGDAESQKYALMLLNEGVSKTNPKPTPYTKWAANLGVRGRVSLKSRVVPAIMSADSLTALIEDYIIEERALELAFEGKRWDDLVRVSLRRGTPEYLAAKVASKFGVPGNPKYDEIYDKLMVEANWYLPFNGIELP